MAWWTTVGLVLGVAVTLWGHWKESRSATVFGKLLASACFVIFGALRWSPGDAVGAWILVGLGLCAVGDGLLLLEKGLDAGIVVFLAGHLAYIVALMHATPASRWSVAVLMPVVAVALVAAYRLWPYLGRRKKAVAVYITVISVMLWGALAAAMQGAVPGWTAVGACSFYLSDLTVARNRFVRKALVNRVVGLPLYYAGQMLIALTVGAAGGLK
jgi:uncharacterized membrane protein YhhN